MALAHLPIDGVDGCPACTVAEAFTCFPTLVKYSPVPPVATMRMNAVDCYPEAAFVGGVQEGSVPCWITENDVGDGFEKEVIRNLRELALLNLDLGNLPPMPPWEAPKLKQDVGRGQAVVKRVYEVLRQQGGRERPDHAEQVDADRMRGKLPNAVVSTMALRALIQMSVYYADAIEEAEYKRLHEACVSHLEFALSCPELEKVKEIYSRPTLGEVNADSALTTLFTVLLLNHPDVRGDENDSRAFEATLESAVQECQQKALEPIRAIANELVQLQLFDCRIPNPPDDPVFQEAGRFLQMMRKYWEECRALVLVQLNASMDIQPHPLLPFITNMRDRIDTCVDRLSHLDGARGAQDTIGMLLDTVTSSQWGDLQAVPEWTTDKIGEVDLFLEQARLRLGSKSYPLTHAEEMFLAHVDATTGAYRDRLKKELARFRGRAEKMAASFDPMARASAKEGATNACWRVIRRDEDREMGRDEYDDLVARTSEFDLFIDGLTYEAKRNCDGELLPPEQLTKTEFGIISEYIQNRGKVMRPRETGAGKSCHSDDSAKKLFETARRKVDVKQTGNKFRSFRTHPREDRSMTAYAFVPPEGVNYCLIIPAQKKT